LENFLQKWQLQRIAQDPRTHTRDSLIVANDEMLIFLPNPQSPRIFDKFQEKMIISNKFQY